MKLPRTQLFALEEYEARIQKVRELMEIKGLDVLIIHSPENIYYLSGYQTPGYYWYQALILPLESDPVFIAPPHEAALIPEFCWIEDSRIYPDTSDWSQVTAEILKEIESATSLIGLETKSRFLTVDFYQSMCALLPDSRLADGSGLVESCRLLKSSREIDYIREAAEVSSRGMKAGIAAVIEGASELEIAASVHTELDMAGSEYTGLPAFITSGERSQLVHATWSPKLIESGDINEVVHRLQSVVSKVNLLFPNEAMALRDGLKDEAGAKEFSKALSKFLRDADSTAFDRLVEATESMPVEEGKSSARKWPVVTIFPFLADPKRFMFLKPIVTRQAADRLAFDLLYETKPNWATYSNLLAMSNLLMSNLSEFGVRDYMDVQSFIWVVGDKKYSL